MNIPYERFVQWAAGPISIGVGYVATLLAPTASAAGFTKPQVANELTKGAVFIVGTAVTYMAHHKWLDNLSKWWTVLPKPAVLGGGAPQLALTSGAVPPEIQSEVDIEMARITAQDAAAQKVQEAGAAPTDVEIEHGLSPTPVA